ncbi:MAG: MBL fold metallo-hydrolase [Gammaproteobacteria bacterium]|nr:MBL fold metallo-hydrolase [Gammaproteobacteria bacterium]NIR84987.1 MBL fold metallo-hydrolase [Gammaproteobacteria bacterium]NIR88254.1 MBL fold metallo-hydrolase [Gammaproteobacteria bacterium]NIU06034.1 MBL fold metallo-hydrolase [Gammaproteobacteria bacterium]NIV73453.1 MBL fold metallo-hydrolase [Gammaproteobacteria bacterium]
MHARAQDWYAVETRADGVTHITEPHIHPFYRCNIWHVRGRERDLLIDSGMGVVSLREHIARVRDRPLLALATHTHFDHIGNHHEFAERAVHRAEAGIMAAPTREATLADVFVSDDIFTLLPPGDYRSEAYAVTPAPATRVLEDGDVVDLGDRHFEVLHLPGHSPGSIALWEAATGILFSGDVVYDGELIDDAYHSVVDDYVASMERVRALPVHVVHGGHFPSFGPERFRVLCDEYIAGKRRPGCPAENAAR